jgi:hypothetical protein
MGLSGEGPARPLAMADNAAAFGVTLLLLRFAGAVLSCGGGLAVASYVKVLFLFLY